MSLLKKVNSRASSTEQTGFGTNSENNPGRFYDKKGAPNLAVHGIGFLGRLSVYNTMLRLPVWKFTLVILSFYFAVNMFFAMLYTFVATGNLGGIDDGEHLNKFSEALFFSAQTLSTVGYGHIYPIGFVTNTIAAIESLIGLLAFALATGMMYGRFSQPRAYIRFSENLLFAPYKGKVGVMFRLVTYKHRNLSEAEVQATLAMKVQDNGQTTNRFYPIKLEISKINSLVLSWTLVHAIDDASPFFNLSKEDLLASNAEVLVYLKAYDETFSNYVIARTSYHASEFVYGAKFKLMYHPSPDKSHTNLFINLISEYEQAELPVT